MFDVSYFVAVCIDVYIPEIFMSNQCHHLCAMLNLILGDLLPASRNLNYPFAIHAEYCYLFKNIYDILYKIILVCVLFIS